MLYVMLCNWKIIVLHNLYINCLFRFVGTIALVENNVPLNYTQFYSL